VVGSPHLFTAGGAMFCPTLDGHRDDRGQLPVGVDPVGFGRLADLCFD
jgi:hypothetical protein